MNSARRFIYITRNCFGIRSRGVHHAKVVEGDSTKSIPYDALAKYFARKGTILVTDPPYCILERKRTFGDTRDHKTKRASKIEDVAEVPTFSSLSAYRIFTEKWIRQAISNGLMSGAYMIIWTNVLGKSVIVDVCNNLNYDLVGEYIWAKSTKACAGNGNMPNKFKHFHTVSSFEPEVLLRAYESALIFAPKEDSLGVEDDWIRKRQETGQTVGDVVLRDSLPWTVATHYQETEKYYATPHAQY